MSAFLTSLVGAKNLKFMIQVLIDFHYAGQIATSIAIVWGRPDSY